MTGSKASRMLALTPVAKLAIVVTSYIAAYAAALAVIAVKDAFSGHTTGMLGFSDTFWFEVVFAFAAVPAPGAALWFLRPLTFVWILFSGVAVGVAGTGLVILALPAMLGQDAALLPIGQMLVAPLLAPGFLVAAWLAPNRGSRIALGAAGVFELACCGVSIIGAVAG